jgi:hypothetical protein
MIIASKKEVCEINLYLEILSRNVGSDDVGLMNGKSHVPEKCKKGYAQGVSKIEQLLIEAASPSCLWKNARDRMKMMLLSTKLCHISIYKP